LQVDFVKDHRQDVGEIRKAVAEGDLKLAHRLAHTLKSTAGMIGRTELQGMAFEVERALSEGDTALAESRLEALESALAVAVRELEPLLSVRRSPAPPSGAAVDAERALELIEKLEPLLKTSNLKCLEMIDDLRLIAGSEVLIEQMEDFEFEPALQTLAGIKQALEAQS